MQAFHRNSRHALPRQFSLDIGQATSTFHRESTRTEDSVALMERAVRTSGNQGPKGQTVVTSRWSRWSRWYLIVVYNSLYSNLYSFLKYPHHSWAENRHGIYDIYDIGLRNAM